VMAQAVEARAAVEVFDERLRRVLPAQPRLERLCTGARWSEGPVWMHEDDSVLWSDIPNNRMLRWSARDGMNVWRANVEFTNGHVREHDGALLHCSHGLRAIVRTRFGAGLSSPRDEIVVDRFEGKRLNSPNDVVVKRDGTIWFTDPPYGIASDHEGHKAKSELGTNCVFCFDPRSARLTVVSDWVEEPNGLAFSADETMLYVSDTSAAMRKDGAGYHHIAAFDVGPGNTLSTPRVFAVIEPGLADGFRLDEQGWIYTSSADSVQVLHTDGTLLGKIHVPEKVGNLTFGGHGRDQLYICASTSLYRIALHTRGIQAP
jgi:gluconolactonase